jgi:hypothetical protein
LFDEYEIVNSFTEMNNAIANEIIRRGPVTLKTMIYLYNKYKITNENLETYFYNALIMNDVEISKYLYSTINLDTVKIHSFFRYNIAPRKTVSIETFEFLYAVLQPKYLPDYLSAYEAIASDNIILMEYISGKIPREDLNDKTRIDLILLFGGNKARILSDRIDYQL